MTYGCQTWTLTAQNMKKLEVCQHNMERSLPNIKQKDRISLKCIRGRTKIADISYTIKKLKWRWVGHLLRNKTEKWAKLVSEWYPREANRKRGRPLRRWDDDLKATAGSIWRRKCQYRDVWKNLGEACARAKQSLPMWQK
ncbi:Putative uncharacterized transposon-derived protein F52C9.6 [Eumeta japonica]|uniref:Uncharacterized transposon-derived protein F52C9.6 n=1 Tax=Eumeta variegata TaxID=151549 RepID=A0A4C1VLR2_EUMVA|nr:Putative uncharacterized transposon-derived protein F52C9.6 [Eumeta japonica]